MFKLKVTPFLMLLDRRRQGTKSLHRARPQEIYAVPV